MRLSEEVLLMQGAKAHEMLAPFERLANELDASVTSLRPRGTATVDRRRIATAIGRVLDPGEDVERHVDAFERIVNAGMAGSSRRGARQFPWMLLTNGDLLVSAGPAALDELGVTGRDVGELRENLSRLGTIPAEFSDEASLRWLLEVRAMAARPAAPGGHGGGIGAGPDPVRPKPNQSQPEGGDEGGGQPAPAVQDQVAMELVKVTDCILAMKIKTGWWGIDICWSKDCARKIGNALASPSGAAILIALAKGVAGPAGALVATIIAAIGGKGTLAFAIGALIYGTALVYKANHCPQTVCLRIWWPMFPLNALPPTVRCS